MSIDVDTFFFLFLPFFLFFVCVFVSCLSCYSYESGVLEDPMVCQCVAILSLRLGDFPGCIRVVFVGGGIYR